VADIKYIISVDEKGAIKAIQSFDKVLDDLQKTTKNKTAPAFAGLWKQMTFGTLAADAFKKGIGFLGRELKGTATAAMDSETATKGLESALSTTGRTVDAMLPDLVKFASEIQSQTTVSDEAALSAMSLLAQLTNLDKEGLQRATESAIGLTTVGVDLESGARLVAKAMMGQEEALRRYGIQIDKNLPIEKQRTQIIEKMAPMFQRAREETDTFRGILKQLGNAWDEVKEAVGRAITENDSIKKLIKEIKDDLIEFVNSGAAAELANSLIDALREVVAFIQNDFIPALGFVAKGVQFAIDEVRNTASIMRGEGIKSQDILEGIAKNLAKLGGDTGDYEIILAALDLQLHGHDVKLDETKKKTDELGTVTGELATKTTKAVTDISKVVSKYWPATNALLVRLWKDNVPGFQKLGEVMEKTLPPALKGLKFAFDVMASGIHAAMVNFASDIGVQSVEVIAYIYDIRKAILGLMGIKLSTLDWSKFIGDAKPVISDTQKAFDGLYNDIAMGFANCIENWFGDLQDFRSLFEGMLKTIKDAFFRMIGEMIAGEILNKFRKFFTEVGNSATDAMANAAKSATGAATSIVQGASGAISGMWLGLGAAVGTFLGTLLTGGGGLGKTEGNWIHEIRNYAADIKADTGWILANLHDIKIATWGHSNVFKSMNGYLKQIASHTAALKNITSAQHGLDAMVRQPTLLMVHGGERVKVTPQSGRMRGGEIIEVHLNNYIGDDKIETKIIKTVNRAIGLKRIRVGT
jgi:hypothetical protein